MSWNKGFNFRGTAGYVTDGENETYFTGSDTYPVTRNGVTFGCEHDKFFSADRNAAIDRRLAGILFVNNSANPRSIRIDLPEHGTYRIWAAIGDNWPLGNYVDWEFCDDTTRFAYYGAGKLDGAHWKDADGNVWSGTDWPLNNQYIDAEFSSQVFRMRQVAPHTSNVISHLFISQLSPISINFSLSGTVKVRFTQSE